MEALETFSSTGITLPLEVLDSPAKALAAPLAAPRLGLDLGVEEKLGLLFGLPVPRIAFLLVALLPFVVFSLNLVGVLGAVGCLTPRLSSCLAVLFALELCFGVVVARFPNRFFAFRFGVPLGILLAIKITPVV